MDTLELHGPRNIEFKVALLFSVRLNLVYGTIYTRGTSALIISGERLNPTPITPPSTYEEGTTTRG